MFRCVHRAPPIGWAIGAPGHVRAGLLYQNICSVSSLGWLAHGVGVFRLFGYVACPEAWLATDTGRHVVDAGRCKREDLKAEQYTCACTQGNSGAESRVA